MPHRVPRAGGGQISLQILLVRQTVIDVFSQKRVRLANCLLVGLLLFAFRALVGVTAIRNRQQRRADRDTNDLANETRTLIRRHMLQDIKTYSPIETVIVQWQAVAIIDNISRLNTH